MSDFHWTTISDAELLELKARLSFQQLSLKFGVSAPMVKRRIKKINSINEAVETLSVIEKLNELIHDVPVGYCRQELYSTIARIREHSKNFSDEQKKSQILVLLQNGESEISEIERKLKFPRIEIESLLESLIVEDRVYKNKRGSHQNKGRKTKELYFTGQDLEKGFVCSVKKVVELTTLSEWFLWEENRRGLLKITFWKGDWYILLEDLISYFGLDSQFEMDNKRMVFSIKEIAEYLGLGSDFLRNEIKKGKLKAKMFGNKFLVLREDFEKYLYENSQETAITNDSEPKKK